MINVVIMEYSRSTEGYTKIVIEAIGVPKSPPATLKLYRRTTVGHVNMSGDAPRFQIASSNGSYEIEKATKGTDIGVPGH